jgi:conjugal transfer pilus assembly protein TraL
MMNGEGDKYNFPETMNQQNRYLGLPIDELIVTAPLLVLGCLTTCHSNLV